MVTVRKIRKKDANSAERIISELHLDYPSRTLDNFWIAEIDNEIVGVVEIKEYDDFNFLSCLGVNKAHQNKGIAKSILKATLDSSKNDTYIYTIIPNFFLNNGFEETNFDSRLPPQQMFNCADCEADKCRCMVKYAK